MSQELADYTSALHDVELASAKLRVAELSLADDWSSALAVNVAQDAMVVAARRLTRATEALPMEKRQRIKGWVEPTPVNSGGAR